MSKRYLGRRRSSESEKEISLEEAVQVCFDTARIWL